MRKFVLLGVGFVFAVALLVGGVGRNGSSPSPVRVQEAAAMPPKWDMDRTCVVCGMRPTGEEVCVGTMSNGGKICKTSWLLGCRLEGECYMRRI